MVLTTPIGTSLVGSPWDANGLEIKPVINESIRLPWELCIGRVNQEADLQRLLKKSFYEILLTGKS